MCGLGPPRSTPSSRPTHWHAVDTCAIPFADAGRGGGQADRKRGSLAGELDLQVSDVDGWCHVGDMVPCW